MDKIKNITRKMPLVFLSVLGTKRENYLVPLYMEKQNITKHVYFVFFTILCTKTSKWLQSTIYSEMKRFFQKHVFWVSIIVVRYQSYKKHGKLPIWKNKSTKNLSFGYFQLLTYHDAELYAKHPLLP